MTDSMEKISFEASEPSGFSPQTSSDVLVRVENVSKKFCRDLKRSLWYGMKDLGNELLCRRQEDDVKLRKNEFWALKDVSFTLQRGECLGLIGRNGAGKTTLLRMLNGLIKPDKGRIEMRGRVGALIALNAGFNPILTGRENIYVNAAVLGLKKKEADAMFDDIVDFAELGEFIDAPVQSYSSGMQVRLGFSIAIHTKPDFLIVDEILAVGDIAFQRQCLQRMQQFIRQGGGLILVSHNMHQVQTICDRGVLLHQGRMLLDRSVIDAIDAYQKQQNTDDNSHCTELNTFKPSLKIPIVIKAVTISAIKDGTIAPGSGVRISLHYDALDDDLEANWGISIWSADQTTRLFTCSDRYQKQPFLTKKSGTVFCEIQKLPLAPGSYAIKAGAYDPLTAWPIDRRGWDNPPVFFEVNTGATEKIIRSKIDGDLMFVDEKWSFQP